MLIELQVFIFQLILAANILLESVPMSGTVVPFVWPQLAYVKGLVRPFALQLWVFGVVEYTIVVGQVLGAIWGQGKFYFNDTKCA